MLVNIIGVHFSSPIDVTFIVWHVSAGQKNVVPFAINVNKIYPIKYKGKPN